MDDVRARTAIAFYAECGTGSLPNRDKIDAVMTEWAGAVELREGRNANTAHPFL